MGWQVQRAFEELAIFSNLIMESQDMIPELDTKLGNVLQGTKLYFWDYLFNWVEVLTSLCLGLSVMVNMN